MATQAERAAAREARREGRREARAEGRALRLLLRAGRRWRNRTVPDDDALTAREQSAAEFDAEDIVQVDGNPEACFHCGSPAETVSLTFEARLHPRCADAAWEAYFRALRG